MERFGLLRRGTRSLAALVVVLALGCGGGDGGGDDPGGSTYNCQCAICVNFEPQYPSRSEEDCVTFAESLGCESATFTDGGCAIGAPLPVCAVRGCVDPCEGCGAAS